MSNAKPSGFSEREATSDTNALRSLWKAHQTVGHLLEQKTKALEKAKSDVVELHTENRKLKEQLQTQINKHNEVLVERDELRADVSQHHEKCEAKCQQYEARLRAANQDIETLKSGLDTINEQNTSLRENVDSTAATFLKLKDAEKAAKKGLEAKETETRNIAKLKDKADKDLSQIRQQLREREQEFAKVTDERDYLKTNNENLKAERNALSTQATVLENRVQIELRNTACVNQEYDALNAHLEDSERRLDSAQRICADAYWVTRIPCDLAAILLTRHVVAGYRSYERDITALGCES
ncbi:MAG: hypothetical protein Q9160_000238 [Pyrenula sp. 1 TL-2023]